MPASARLDLDPKQFWHRESLLDPSLPRQRVEDKETDLNHSFLHSSDPDDMDFMIQGMLEPVTHTCFDGTRASFNHGISEFGPEGLGGMEELVEPAPAPAAPAPTAEPKQKKQKQGLPALPQVLPAQCGNCNALGHFAAECPEPQRCRHCHRLGHWVGQCPVEHAQREKRRAQALAHKEGRSKFVV